MKKIKYEEMLPHELDVAVKEKPIVFLPWGTLEFHGKHLPLGLDGIKAYDLCQHIAKRMGGVVLPPTYWAICKVPANWSIEISERTEKRLLLEIFFQLEQLGFKLIVLLSGHYPVPQVLLIKEVADKFMRTSVAKVLALSDYEPALDIGYYGDHAAMWETSILWAIRSDLVEIERLKGRGDENMNWVAGDDPRTLASSRLGAETVEHIVENLSAEIDAILNGKKIDNMGAHKRWAQLRYTKPLQFFEESLRNIGKNSISFEVGFEAPEPYVQSYFVTRILPLEVDGKVFPSEKTQITDSRGNTWQASEVRKTRGFYISSANFSANGAVRVPMQATFTLIDLMLEPGEHQISVGLELGGVIKMRIRTIEKIT